MKPFFLFILLFFFNFSALKATSDTLLSAVKNNNEEHVYQLLREGVSPNIQTDLGITPLMLAVLAENENLVSVLLSFGAQTDPIDQAGGTALHLAAGRNNQKIMQKIITKGADVNAQNFLGLTPLMIAIISNNPENVSIFVNAGADVNIKSKENVSAVQYAVLNNQLDIFKKLIEKAEITEELYGTIYQKKNSDNFIKSLPKSAKLHKAPKNEFIGLAKDVKEKDVSTIKDLDKKIEHNRKGDKIESSAEENNKHEVVTENNTKKTIAIATMESIVPTEIEEEQIPKENSNDAIKRQSIMENDLATIYYLQIPGYKNCSLAIKQIQKIKHDLPFMSSFYNRTSPENKKCTLYIGHSKDKEIMNSILLILQALEIKNITLESKELDNEKLINSEDFYKRLKEYLQNKK